jgi:ribosomal-protein-serine acetyltransferase
MGGNNKGMDMEKRTLQGNIKGSIVTLKKHKIELAQKMYDYVVEDRERLAKFLPWPNFIKSVDDEVAFINQSNEAWEEQSGFHFGVFRNSDDEYLGNIGCFSISWDNCSTEIGYWILGKFEGRGYMSEAVTLLEAALFDIGFNRIVIRFQPKNKKSGNIPRRLNYSHDGTLRNAQFSGDVFEDLEVYSKLKEEFLRDKKLKAGFEKCEITFENELRAEICQKILRSLPKWFGIESAINNYVKQSPNLPMLTIKVAGEVVGFVSIKKHNEQSCEIYVLGILPNFHRRGLGYKLMNECFSYLRRENVKYIQVKTLGPTRENHEYEGTRKFYELLGFAPLEELPDFWNEDNPCLIMVKRL